MKIETMLQRFSCSSFLFKPPSSLQMKIPESKTISKNYLVQKTISKREIKGAIPRHWYFVATLIFCCYFDILLLLPMIVKIDAITFELNMANNYQGFTKKQCQRLFTVSHHGQTLLGNALMEEGFFTLF